MLVSDHGEMAGDYNMMGKGNFYEEVIRVPMIAVPPGGNAPPRRIAGLVETTDLAPPILDYAGVAIPPQMPTQSLRPLIEGDGEAREAILCEYLTNDQARKGKCVRTERYKYAFWGREHPPEFYDLQEDPDEMRNLYGDPRYAEEIARHKDILLDRLLKSEQFYFRDETPSDRDLQIWIQ